MAPFMLPALLIPLGPVILFSVELGVYLRASLFPNPMIDSVPNLPLE